jgi:type IV secretory pathway VirB2 component (pilin)
MNIFKTTTWLFNIVCMLCIQIIFPIFAYGQAPTLPPIKTPKSEAAMRSLCETNNITHFVETWQHLGSFSRGSDLYTNSSLPVIGAVNTTNQSLVEQFLADKDFFEHILIAFPAERRLKRAYREGLHSGQNAANPSVVSPSKIDIYNQDRCTSFLMNYLPKDTVDYKSYVTVKNSINTTINNIYPEVLLYYFQKGFFESFEGISNSKNVGDKSGNINGFQTYSFTDIYDPAINMQIDFKDIQQDEFRIGIYDDTHIHDLRRGILSLQFISYEYRKYGASSYFIEIPRVLPVIELRIDDEEEINGFTNLADLDVVSIYRSDTSLDEIKLLNDVKKNPNMIVRVLEGSVEFRGISDVQTVVSTSASPLGTVSDVTRMEVYATDQKADRIIVDPFREQLVADGEEYDGRGGGVKAVEKGKFRGLVETDNSDELFKGIINFFLSFVGAIAVLMLVFAGFMFITDGGSSSQSEKALKTIQNTVIGIIVILSSYTIVNTVLDFNGNARDQVRVDIKMGASTLLGATLARGGCMYTGATAGVVRLCNENGLLILKVQSLNINTFWPLEEVRGTCRKASIFTICIEDEY